MLSAWVSVDGILLSPEVEGLSFRVVVDPKGPSSPDLWVLRAPKSLNNDYLDP